MTNKEQEEFLQELTDFGQEYQSELYELNNSSTENSQDDSKQQLNELIKRHRYGIVYGTQPTTCSAE